MADPLGGTKIGQLIVEIDADRSKYDKKVDEMVQSSGLETKKIGDSWKALGVKNDEHYAKLTANYKRHHNKLITDTQLSANERLAIETQLQAKLAANEAKHYAARNAPYKTMGIRSNAAIEIEKTAVSNAYAAMVVATQVGTTERYRINQAFNEKIKTLNNELTGHHEMSMAAMTRAVLRFYAAWFVASSAIMGVKNLFMGGVEAIDSMKTSAVAIAAMITNMQGSTGNIAENYKKNIEYSKALVPVLMQIDAQSFANLEEINLMNRAAATHGQILDSNNKKQVGAFTAITNAIALLTTGQNKTIQSSQEMNALLTGEVKQQDRVAKMVDDLIKRQGEYKNGLKGLVAEGNKYGDTLERLAPYFIGIQAASGDISKTWEAVSASMKSAWIILQQDVFAGFYKSLVKTTQQLAEFIKANREEIATTVKYAWDTLVLAIEAATVAVTIFGVAHVLASIKAIGAITAIKTAYATLAAFVVGTTAKMGVAWAGLYGVMFAVGYEAGKYLGDKFEFLRIVGVNAAANIADAWNATLTTLQIMWEKTKAIASATYEYTKGLNPLSKQTMEQSKANVAAINKEKDARISAIKEGYEFQKKINDLVTKKQLADSKTIARFTRRPDVPTVQPGKGDGTDDKVKKEKKIRDYAAQDAKNHYDELTALNKEYYESALSSVEWYTKRQREAGQYEVDIVYNAFSEKNTALTEWYNKQVEIINVLKIREAEKAEYLAKLDKEYYSQKDKNIKDFRDATDKAQKDEQKVVENAYLSMSKLSPESLVIQIDRVTESYKSQLQQVEAGTAKAITLEKARDAEIFNLRQQNTLALAQLELNYLQATRSAWDEDVQRVKKLIVEINASIDEATAKASGKSYDKEGVVGVGVSNVSESALQDQANYYDQILGMEEEAYQKKLQYIELERQARIKAAKGSAEGIKAANLSADQQSFEALEKKIDGEQYWGRMVIRNFSDMLDAASSCYAEDSKQFKRLQDAKKVAFVAEMAMEAQKNLMLAVGAVLQQGSGEPYTAWARMAAMVGFVANILAIAGVAFSGGGGGGGASTGPSYTGKSTVLGAADDAVSESFKNSLEILNDTYSMEYNQLRKLNDQMEALNNNITGLVANIFNTGNLGKISVNAGTFGKNNLTPLRKFDKDFMGGAGFDFFTGGWLGDLGGYNFGANFFENVFDNLGGWLFGGKTTVKNKGQGIGVTFRDAITGKGLVGSYSNPASSYGMDTLTIGDLLAGESAYVFDWAKAKAKTEGGLFGKDKTSKKYQTLAESDEVSRAFNLVFQNLGATLTELAGGLGAETASVLNYAFQSFRLDFKGKSGEEIQKIIEDEISRQADVAAGALFGGIIEQYQKVNEGLYETAVRLATDKAVIEEIIGMTGQRFPDIAANAIELSEALIDIAGSLSDLQESASNYFDKFYTDQEKHLYLQDQLNDALNDMGLSLAVTRDGYRAMVEALDLTAESGRYAYVTMMDMADYADKYYSYLEDQAGSFDQEMQDNASLFRTREDYIRALNTGKSEDTPEAKDRKEMLSQLKMLREDMSRQGYIQTKNTKKTADILDEWKTIGMPATQMA